MQQSPERQPEIRNCSFRVKKMVLNYPASLPFTTNNAREVFSRVPGYRLGK
jgi:hypothetical protein